ncbi:MAG: AtpZ/AtpI family protein [Anaerolineae bacterium]
MAKKSGVDFKSAIWVLAVGGQLGLSIALPVLIGLAVGYWIDTRLGSLPWVTLLLTLVGTISGPIIVYRWVVHTMRKRFEEGEESE